MFSPKMRKYSLDKLKKQKIEMIKIQQTFI